MNQFNFSSRQKTTLIGGMLIGVICLIITFFSDDALHTRFWTNYLHNTVFFLGIAFTAVFFIAVNILAWGGWHTLVKRVFEAMYAFLIPGLLLLLVVVAGVWGHFHHLYHWADAAAVAEDRILTHKSAFLNKNWYTFGTLIIVGLWIYFAYRLRQLSVQEDSMGQGDDFARHKKMRHVASFFLPLAGFSSAAMIWQWIMSVDSHWYSTMFAWYATASWFVAMMALVIILVAYLKSLGYLPKVTMDHYHDLGKFMFAFSIFWTYLWFSQFMLIWYGNVGEETIYFKERMDNYPVMFWGNLVLNFLAPFFVLMRNDTKRKYGTMVFAACIVFVGHWWDYFQMIKPGALHTAHEVLGHGGEHHGGHSAALAGFNYPGLLELGTMIGFLSFFLFITFRSLTKASLEPVNDPYFAESVHHHT